MEPTKKYRAEADAWAVYARNVRNHGVSAGVRHAVDDEGDYWYLPVDLQSYDAPVRSPRTRSDA